MHHTYTSIIILLFFTRFITPNNNKYTLYLSARASLDATRDNYGKQR